MPENQTNDLAIPEIKLVQNVGGDEAKQMGAQPGDFYCAITQEIIPGAAGFDIVVVKPPQKTRTYWGTTDISDEPPTCASLDGVTSINGDICMTACPYNAFTDAPYMVDASERRSKCLPNYNIIAVQLSSMMPVMIRCSGISAMAARELNTLLKFHKSIRGNTIKAKIHVVASKKKTAAGEAFAIKFGQPALLEGAEIIAELRELASAVTGAPVALPEACPEPEQLAPPVEAEPAKAVKAEAPKVKAEAPKNEPPPQAVQKQKIAF